MKKDLRWSARTAATRHRESASLSGLGAWSMTQAMSVAVIALGRFEVSHSRQAVQHLHGGVVAEVLVREGQHHPEGHVLVRLDGNALRSDLVVVEGQFFKTLARKARLEAEEVGTSDLKFDPLLTSRARPWPSTPWRARDADSRRVVVRSDVRSSSRASSRTSSRHRSPALPRRSRRWRCSFGFPRISSVRSAELKGFITGASAGVFQEQVPTMPFYRAEVELAPDETERPPDGLEPIPGMPVEAFIRPASRTQMDFLLEPITGYLQRPNGVADDRRP